MNSYWLALTIGDCLNWWNEVENGIVIVRICYVHRYTFDKFDFKKEIKDDFLAVHTIPGSAYQRCLPDETIDIGTCSLVLHWLSDKTVKTKCLRDI
uniref:Uncharacterized protein n=1 Tax=Magallana gigas TaxID=29159 RepID=A0A8W8P5T6_MAGGI